MKTIGDQLEPFSVVGVKPGFNEAEEHGRSAFVALTADSFPGKWKVIYFYPKDFTHVCPTEIVVFDRLSKDFSDRGAVLMGGSTDNEFVKLAWRCSHPGLDHLGHYSFADPSGQLVDQLGIRDRLEGVALRATFIIDPDNLIQHVSVNNLQVGRNPDEILRILDALQTESPCVCQREPGGQTL
jgi:alkyl hydroperoxide reductase subunit AhpC